MINIDFKPNSIECIHITSPANSFQDNEGYDVYLSDSFYALSKVMNPLCIHNSKICIISDNTVSSIYLNSVSSEIKPAVGSVYTYIIDNGEKSKNLNTIEQIISYLLAKDFKRDDVLIALGGGVVGDITGFCASIYMRGIRYINIPTSLLAQTDSSVGGKCAVDFSLYKNIIGSFHQPSLVFINTQTYISLDICEQINGMSEIIKQAIIGDSELFRYLEESSKNNFDKVAMATLIYNSLLIKKTFIEKDPYDIKERNILNFGHTIGHAIEKISAFNISHGQAVSLGMVAASKVALNLGYIDNIVFLRIKNLLLKYGLPVKNDFSDLQILELLKILESDKKNTNEGLKFILIEKIGKGIINKNVPKELILDSLKYLR